MNAAALSIPSYLQAAFAEQSALPVRQQAFDQFLRLGFPTTRNEQWKYTNLRRLESRGFIAGKPNAPVALPALETYQLTFVDGHYRSELSQLPIDTGVKIQMLSAAHTNVAELLNGAVSDATSLAALNTALTQDGALIELATNTVLQKPLWLRFIWSDQAQGMMAHPRIVIRMQAHSKAVIVAQYSGYGTTAHFNNVVTTAALSDGAQLEYCHIQNENTASFHIGLLNAEVAAQAQLTTHHINMGAALARMDINVLLQGAGANVSLNGLQFAGGTQHHDTHTRVEHCVPHTSSQEDYRGIADQRGRVVFNGKVVVREKAIKTDAQQSSRNLLLASTAEIDTKPELEIYNDDVKCAHGATVGQLDANALFYLRSRGLDAAQARALLTHAFADHIVRQLPVAILREQLSAASHARFGATLEINP